MKWGSQDEEDEEWDVEGDGAQQRKRGRFNVLVVGESNQSNITSNA